MLQISRFMYRTNKLSGVVAHDLSGFIWHPIRISDETDRVFNEQNDSHPENPRSSDGSAPIFEFASVPIDSGYRSIQRLAPDRVPTNVALTNHNSYPLDLLFPNSMLRGLPGK